MAYSSTILQRGVCGNVRFKFFTITDCTATETVVKTDMEHIKFIASTQTSDKQDHWGAQTLSISGTAATDVTDFLDNNGKTFVFELDNLQVYNTADNLSSFIYSLKTDATRLGGFLKRFEGFNAAAENTYDICPDGNETWKIASERHILIDAVTGADDGTIIVLGA